MISEPKRNCYLKEIGLRIVLILCLTILVGMIPKRSDAPTPPETYSLKEIQPGEAAIDPQFEKWLDEVENYPSPLEYSDSEYKKFISNLHPTEALLLDIKRSSRLKRKARRKFVKDTIKRIESTHGLRDSILYPDMLNALIETDLLKGKDLEKMEGSIQSWPGNSCPHKRSILRNLDIDKELMPAKDVEGYLQKIAQFNSERFKEKSLERLMEMVSEESHGALKPQLTPPCNLTRD